MMSKHPLIPNERLCMFGQLVIGPPGSGKTTYCNAMANYLTDIGRSVAVVNLDPANENIPYFKHIQIDINELIILDDVMESLALGPNGGLIYAMSFLNENRQWFVDKLVQLKKREPSIYLLVDCPGQIELYTNDTSMNEFVHYLCDASEGPQLRLTCVNLVDAHYCADAGNFISVLLMVLSTMLQLSRPHVNVLSKVDLLKQFGELPFNLDFFTEVLDLNYLVDSIQDKPFNRKYKRLNKALADLIQDQSIIQFSILSIQEQSQLRSVLNNVDKANGYVFGAEESSNIQSMSSCASVVQLNTDEVNMAEERFS